MIRLLGVLTLFFALHPAARPLPRAEQTLAVASPAHPAPIALDHVNSLGSAVSTCFTLPAPIASVTSYSTPTPFSRVSRRWLLASRLLL